MNPLPPVQLEVTQKILLVGGAAVGKTSFIRRFFNEPLHGLQYVPTVGVDVIVYPLPPQPMTVRNKPLPGSLDNKAGASENFLPTNTTTAHKGSIIRVRDDTRPVHLHFWDVSHKELTASPSHHALICTHVAGVFLVFDVGNRASLAAVDAWQHLLAHYVPAHIPRVLLAHKADLMNDSRCCVTDRILEAYRRAAGLTDWCWTVGHECFGDYVASRSSKSRPVADAVQLLVDHMQWGREGRDRGEGGGGSGGGRGGGGAGGPEAFVGRGERWGNGERAFEGHVSVQEGDEKGEGEAKARREPQRGEGGREDGREGGAEEGCSAMRSLRYGYVDTEKARAQRRQGRSPAPCLSPAFSWPRAGFPRVALASYQPPRGWLPSEDLAVLFGRSPAASVTLGVFQRQQLDRRRERRTLMPSSVPLPLPSTPPSPPPDPGWRHLAGSMGREAAERLLRAKPPGTFLLRRYDERSLRLSYRTRTGVEHAPLVFTREGRWAHVRRVSTAGVASPGAGGGAGRGGGYFSPPSTAPSTPLRGDRRDRSASTSSTSSPSTSSPSSPSSLPGSTLPVSTHALFQAQAFGHQLHAPFPSVPLSIRPARRMGRGSIGRSEGPLTSPFQPPPQSEALQPPPSAPPQSFASLEELLSFFRRKAAHGLCFRRVPGTCDYEELSEGGDGRRKTGPWLGEQEGGEGGGGGMGGGRVLLGWFQRRISQPGTASAEGRGGPSKQEGGRKGKAQAQGGTCTEDTFPSSVEVVEVFKSLHEVLAAVGRRDGAERQGRGGVEAREREAGLGTEEEEDQMSLLRLCDQSAEPVLAALGLKTVSPAPEEGPWRQEHGREGEAMDLAALVEKIVLLDMKIFQLLSTINRLLLVATSVPSSSSPSPPPSMPPSPSASSSRTKTRGQKTACLEALRVLGRWRPLLKTLRLRFQTEWQYTHE